MKRRAAAQLLATSLLSIASYGVLSMNTPVHAAPSSELRPGPNRVHFTSEGVPMVGDLYLPAGYRAGDKLPAVVVTGSWTTVKEQMAGAYARRLAEQGYAALAFDFRFFGESGGEPRQLESPAAKTRDILSAVTFLESVPAVHRGRIGALAVCASAGYMADAVAQDRRLRAYVAVAPWLHDAELVEAIYGGEAGVQRRLQATDEAEAQARRGEGVRYVPAVSTTDASAAMFGQLDYYLNPRRGAIPAWDNRFAVQSWREWLIYSPMPSAARIRVPVLLVHSEQAAVPAGARKWFGQVSAPKKMLWLDGATQFDFYDQPAQMEAAIRAAVAHFAASL